MTGVSELKLTNYKVIRTMFELNEEFEFKQGKIDIQPVFKRDIEKVNDNHYRIRLGIKISNEVNKKPLPFNAEVIISSTFELPGWESEELNKVVINNATAIMFPYLRTLMATLTMNGNVPPYMLPIMNIAKLFDLEK